MTREILFRGKRIDNGEWVEGFYMQDGSDPVEHYICGEGLVIPESVGQYTGLIDENGKKIFEGDIINGYTFSGVNDFRNAVVHWSDLFVSWQAGDRSLYGGGIGDYEVVGNIHDNSEEE